ncbi:hypothetical protein RhiirA4_496374 [Rhizophagus irregularis]|uniref:Uncharacterized protein n=1 Tax=Rhizophagus irregularis TaxID=588596 RepID=A0A2I1H0E9_9GLOM|nr:hypothetical protein RhiirA4_532146 [Rhizophagus irregularis]PKY52360.1 hypothetical protein RhiirA4_496374 [Rhizophagus irregularis]
MEVLEKQAEETKKKIIEDNINYLLPNFKKLLKPKNPKIEEDLSQSVIGEFNKHATTKEMEKLREYINDFPNGDIDDITVNDISVSINKLVNNAINRPIKKKIGVDLEEFFTKKIEAKNETENQDKNEAKNRNQDETKNQDQNETKNPGEIINELKNLDDPVEIINKFSRIIHITTFEDLEEDNIDNIDIIYKQLKDETIEKIKAKNFAELIKGNVDLGDELNKLINNFCEFKKLVKDIINEIKIVESMENDIKDILQAKDLERENKLIKKIKNIKIDKFMENFIKKIENLPIKGLGNFKFVDFSKEDKDITTNESVKKFIDGNDIEETKNEDNSFKIKIKVLENFKKEYIKDIENINNSTAFVKKIIKIGLLYDFINKKSEKSEENIKALSKDLSKVDEVDEENKELKELVNDFIEDIVTIKKEGLEKNVIDNMKQKEDHNKDSKQLLEIFISKIKLAILEESSKNFVKAMINSQIKKLKDELIRVINQDSNNNEKPYIEALRKFLEIIDMINIKKIEMFENINSKNKEQEISQFETTVMEPFNKEINNVDNINNQMTIFIGKIKKLKIKDLNKWKSAAKIEVKNLAKELGKHEKPDIIKGVAKIEEELEQQIITKIEDIEDIEDIDLVKLQSNFNDRVTKVKTLGKDPNNLEIRIDRIYGNLVATKDLIRLFCSDSDLNRITTSIYSDDSDSKIYLNILAYDELLNSNEIVILTNIGIFIFHLNLKLNKSLSLNEKLISLKHFYYIYQPEQSIKSLCHVHYFHTTNYLDSKIINYRAFIGWSSYVKRKEFTKYCGPTSLMLTHGWASYVKDNGEDFLKYGAALLMFAIELNDLELIDGIYKKCLKLFSQNLEKNKAFLSIITTSMPLLNDFYPEYIEKYSSDTNMIIDSLNYKIEYLGNSHLHPFSDIEIVDLSPSIYWLDYAYNLDKLQHKHKIFYVALLIIQLLIYFLTFPISFPIFYILNYFHVINEIHTDGSSFFHYRSYYFISKKIKENKLRFQIFPGKPKPTITFLVPYIKFVNYPQNYNWLMEFFIRPKPNPFVKTINRAIYETWGGEAMINFKWEKYGRYYYAIIWIIFAALLGCFTAATTLSEDYISEKDRKILYISSIFLGIIHLIIELRQFIFDPIAWISDPWNYFGKNKYLFTN